MTERLTAFGERFLTNPSLFPARIAGEPWGEDSLTLDLAGGPFRISGLTARQLHSLSERFDASPSLPAFKLLIYRAPRSDFRQIDTKGWEYSLDFAPQSIAGMNVMARIDLDRSRAAIWTPVTEDDEFCGVIENVLRPIVASRLLAGGGLLVHSAAANGVLFAGPSGAGKSTLARLSLDAGIAVLSDDLNAVVPDGDGFQIVPLPFSGTLAPAELSHAPTPLRAVVRIEKSDRESLAPISRGETVSLLVRSAPYVNRDPLLTELLLDRAVQIAGSAQTVALGFRRDANVWPILSSLCP